MCKRKVTEVFLRVSLGADMGRYYDLLVIYRALTGCSTICKQDG